MNNILKKFKIQNTIALLFLFVILFSFKSFSAPDNSTADALSAKGFLEEIMVKRYTQSLGTFVNHDSFTVGAQIEIVDAPKKEPPKTNEPQVDTPFDLLVGTLDSEKLIKQYALEAEKPALVSYLSTKKIKAVVISVGLKEELGEPVKVEVDKWLKDRVRKEFGNVGKTEVNFVKQISAGKKDEKETHPKKEWWDWLEQFQNLAGVVFLALSLLIGILMWRMTTSKANANLSNTNNSEGQQIKLVTEGKGLGGGGGGSGHGAGADGFGDGAEGGEASAKNAAEQEKKNIAEAFTLTQKINAIASKVTGEVESLIRNWNNEGDEGRFKIVCFAEAVGKEVGRLPIPPDAVVDLAKVFSKMSEVSIKQKKEALEKIYWDLVTVLNLGSEVLVQPFSYLATTDASMLSQILMDQNPKLKTLVSHYLPDDIRKKFINPLNPTQKIELLNSAAKLKDISRTELRSIDKEVKGQLGGEVSADSVPLDMTFEKIVGTLSVLEEMELLPQVQGEEIIRFKRTSPSVAFFHEWPEEKLSFALGKLRPDQIVTYLRFKPDLKDKFLKLCPPMTAEVVTDDLNQTDRSTPTEKEKSLKDMSSALKEFVSRKEINLEDIFSQATQNKDNVVEIKSA